MRFDFSPESRLIARTSKYLCDVYGGMLADPEASARVMLTAHELLENAAKYSTDGVGQLQVELSEEPAGGFGVVSIRSSNRAQPERLSDLRQFFEESGQCPDAVALYDRMIARSTTRSFGSGLGLARIQAEAEMKLSYSLKGNEVTITAEARMRVKPELTGRRAGASPGSGSWGGHGPAHD
jgi:two-component sensor histidine kinase